MLFNKTFFYLTVLFHIVAAPFFISYLIRKKESLFLYGKQWLSVAAVSGALFLFTRYREAGYLPLVNLFEITFFYSWMINLYFIIFVKRDLNRFVQAFVLFTAYVILAWDIFLDKGIYPLNPLLKSYWLGIHVPVAILSYSAFVLSFAISLYYLYAKSKDMVLGHLAALNSGLTMWGVFLLGVCIATGAVWARSAWGRFWSWDPKETWALITFMIYAGSVLMRRVFKLEPKWQAILSIAGFSAMLFTFFGVGLFFASHHSYR
jgi:ABC-type transport system involved in cytochrome c biogenesis permease subunit